MNLPSLGPRGEGWLAGQLLLFVAAGLASGVMGRPHEGLPLWAGLTLVAAGFIVAAKGTLDLGSSLSVFPRPKGSARLVDDGIYGHIRHPIYAGLVLVSAGVALARLSVIGAALTAALAVFLDLKARREEALLATHYPGYTQYRERTRRFIPRVY